MKSEKGSASELVDLDELWDFSDPAKTEERFSALLNLPSIESNPDYHVELLTQIARTHSLRRQFEQANEMLDRAGSLLVSTRSKPGLRLLLERGRTLNSSGSPALAKPLFEEAWSLGRAIKEDGLAADAAHMVAITEEGPEALRWNLLALELAESSVAPSARKWRKSLHNNLGWTYFEMGEFETALGHFKNSRQCAEEAGDAQSERIARWCIGKSLRVLGRLDEALATQLELMAESGDPAGFRSEEAGECLLAMGREEEARSYFATAYQLLSEDAWLVKTEPERLARLQRLISRPAGPNMR